MFSPVISLTPQKELDDETKTVHDPRGGLTANQVLLWKALQLVGATSMPTQYGRVFTHIKEPTS